MVPADPDLGGGHYEHQGIPDLRRGCCWSQGAAFSADGRAILVGNMVEKEIQVFELTGNTLRDTGHRIKVKGGPAAIRSAEK